MFDDNNIDKMMKSILENGQEEVPAHIWEGVSAGLDKAAGHKAVVIWFRRAAIGVASAAAAITLGILYSNKAEEGVMPQNTVMLADSEGDIIEVAENVEHEEILVAESNVSKEYHKASTTAPYLVPATAEDAYMSIETWSEPAGEPDQEEAKGQEKDEETDLYVWEDEEEFKKPIRASLVLSGITGTNSAQAKGRANIMKRPSVVAKPIETGITETSTNTIYGIPVSVGTGVKIDFNERWSLGVGVNYSYLSSRFYGTYTLAKDGVEISSTASDIKNSQHFVGIPGNAYYHILGSKNISLYAYAGGTVEKCVSDKYEVLSTSIVHKEKPKGMQLSANAGIGVEFLLGQHLGLYVDPSLRYYFDNNQPKSIRTAQPLTFGFEMGLRVRL